MKSRTMIAVLLAGLVLSGVPYALAVARGATRRERQRAATEKVQAALRLEIEGKNAEREEALQSALQEVPDYPPAMWHSGHVCHHNEWVKFDKVADTCQDDQRIVAYRRRREKSPDTAAGQLELARWCAENKLPGRARAHLTRVLDLEPDHAEARRLLGYRKVEGVWISEQEIRQAAARAAEVAKALKEWKPRLQAILEGLGHRAQRQREIARERLLAINDPAAIPALELMLSKRSEDVALLAVQVLDKMEAPEAAVALARQAAFSRCERVRQAAAENLKSRDPAGYVPMLLSAMVTPIRSRAELYRAPNGRLMYRHALYREGQERAELAVFETEYRRTLLRADDPESHGVRQALLAIQRQADAAKKAQRIEITVAQQNALVGRLNERICWVLSQATGEDVRPDPEAWWQWWNEYNGVFVAGAKPLRHAYRRDSVQYDDPYEEMTYVKIPRADGGGAAEVLGYRDVTVMRRYGMSCLLAGTPVWTDSGLVPIETIRVGDLVLSQNPETGELAYKPVLKTTVRPPTQMLKIVFGGKALQCSGGHPFWIAGHGWVFARDLKDGMPLHTVDGTVEVRSVHATGIEALHNLVVADFHTYFVTEPKILTHDNTIRRPTQVVVPGLAKRS